MTTRLRSSRAGGLSEVESRTLAEANEADDVPFAKGKVVVRHYRPRLGWS